ncbi:MAG: winged helix-turn-helix transcriptional regulator [Phaeodactylibacter sp.]|nr:winged helix-turn-helix transcriptional regulator [Phaeodactylibacter sp.]MCB9275329.1 winged helix-turn-helix transcriptional regulator [Lewinellaceae bacterium]
MPTPSLPYTAQQEKLARYAKALSHPARIYILRFLDKQCACYVGNIVDELPMAQSSVSQHLKELKNAGLIQGTVEPPKIKYCINRENWREAQAMFAALFEER